MSVVADRRSVVIIVSSFVCKTSVGQQTTPTAGGARHYLGVQHGLIGLTCPSVQSRHLSGDLSGAERRVGSC